MRFFYISTRIVSKDSSIIHDDFISFLRERLHDTEFEYARSESCDPSEDTQKIGILIFISDLGIIDYETSTDIRSSFLDHIDPLLRCDDDPSWDECVEIWGDIFIIERDEHMHSGTQVRGIFTDIDVIEIESSLDDGLILTIGDDMVTETSK